MTVATVKTFFPEKKFGFLHNPKGGKDIFFRQQGREWAAGFDNETVPEKGREIEVLSLSQSQKGLRATKWRML